MERLGLTSKPVQILPIVFVSSVALLSGVRLFILISNHAVNILYWDQWDYYLPLFEHKSLWEMFNWQYGIHRQGIGFILTKVIADATQWNTRTEAFAVGGLVCLATLTALWLKRRLFGSLATSDVAIPLIVLTTSQFQTFIGALNPSPQAFPLLLIILYCVGWTLRRRLPRYLVVSSLNFLLIYTGYGILVGPITVALLAVDCWHQRKDARALMLPAGALAISLGSALLFLRGYALAPTVDALTFRQTEFWEYPLFMGLMFGRFIRPETGKLSWLSYLAFILGIALFVLSLYIVIHHLRRLLIETTEIDLISLTIFVLLGFCLLCTFATSLGRAPQGLNVSQSSRYMTLMTLGFLGLYFHFLTLKTAIWRRLSLTVFSLLLLPGHLPLTLGNNHPAGYFSINKRSWKACYLSNENIELCDRLTGFPIHPSAEVLRSKLSYLKQHRLNLYSGTE